MKKDAHIRWISLKKSNDFVVKYHRHHKERQGAIFSIGLYYNLDLVGVAICGRPSSRHLDIGDNMEVYRVCLYDGIKNGCSILYSCCARIAQEMGFNSIITYTLNSESGDSLKASGWILVETNCGGKKWNSSKGIKRTNKVVNLFGEQLKSPEENKNRWFKPLYPKRMEINTDKLIKKLIA